MTISPPSNVKLKEGESARVLANGIDSLVLAMTTRWESDETFKKLAELKAAAMEDEKDCTGIVRLDDGTHPWVYVVRPNGKEGYEWILESGEFAMKIMNSRVPKSRPGVMATIRSETLWTHGPQACVDRVRSILARIGAQVEAVKVSRVDPCVDILLPADQWHERLRGNFVTRARKQAPYFDGEKLTGIQVGKGAIVLRLYDKPEEIISQSNKQWMYEVWGVESIDEACRIIRVEFQLRREVIRQLGIDSYDDLMRQLGSLWAYCTQKWLRVVDDRSKHHTMQKVLPWWEVVQAGMANAMSACPCIRARSIRDDIDQVGRQMLGLLSSLVALHRQGDLIEPDEVLDLGSHLELVNRRLLESGWADERFTVEVKRKQAKRIRHGEKFMDAARAREALRLSSYRKPKSGKKP